LPTTMEMVGDLKKGKEEEEETGPRDIQFHPGTQKYEDENNSQTEPPRLESLKRKASIYSTSSSVWSTDPIPSDSRIQSSKRNSVWSMDPLPSDPIKRSTTKPRRATIASTTVRVRELPRELSLKRVVTEEDSDDDSDDDHLPKPQLPTPKHNNSTVSTVHVHCKHIVDACNRRGVYSGILDLKTQLPHGQGR